MENEHEDEICGKNIDDIMKGLDKSLAKHNVSAAINVIPFAKRIMDNPDDAIGKIVDVYNKGLDEAYTNEKGHNERAFVEAIAGGPNEAVPWAVYNAVGSAYPYLNRDQKDKALSKIVEGILDGINCLYVQITHTPGIKEPLLLSEIAIIRPYYWPGMDDGRYLISKFEDFGELKQKLMNENGMFNEHVNSDFILGYSLLRSDFCKFGEDYAKTVDPPFLDRVLQGIVSKRFYDKTSDKKEIEERTDRLKFLLPESLHSKIEPIRQKADWVDYKIFR